MVFRFSKKSVTMDDESNVDALDEDISESELEDYSMSGSEYIPTWRNSDDSNSITDDEELDANEVSNELDIARLGPNQPAHVGAPAINIGRANVEIESQPRWWWWVGWHRVYSGDNIIIPGNKGIAYNFDLSNPLIVLVFNWW